MGPSGLDVTVLAHLVHYINEGAKTKVVFTLVALLAARTLTVVKHVRRQSVLAVRRCQQGTEAATSSAVTRLTYQDPIYQVAQIGDNGTAFNAITPTPDPKHLCGWNFTFYNGVRFANIVRLNANGSLDGEDMIWRSRRY